MFSIQDGSSIPFFDSKARNLLERKEESGKTSMKK